MKKWFGCLALCLLLMLGLTVSAHGADVGEADAQTLYGLGLFRGVGTLEDGSPDFALENALTRQEAVAMLVRLLGEEQTALNGSWELPFTDVAEWAKPYVGYAYARGLTNGVSAAAFGGTQTVTATQYLTFVLRALGYASGTDFPWNAAWELTDRLGMTHGEYRAENNDAFLRGDAAFVSRSALQTDCKAESGTLLDTLTAKGAVSEEAVASDALLNDPYRKMTRDLLRADCTPMTVTLDGNGSINGRLLYYQNAVFQNHYDGYSESAATVEEAFAKAMEAYAGQCLDGDYSKGNNGYSTFGVGGSTKYRDIRMGAAILTDLKGTIIAYGMFYGDTVPGETVTLYRCDFDTRPYVDPLLKDAKAQLQKMKTLQCTGQLVDGQYVYTISNLPKNAVYYTLDDLGASTTNQIYSNISQTAIIGCHMGFRMWLGYATVDYAFYPVTDVISETAPELDDSKYALVCHQKLLTLWDENKKPVASCFVIIPL